MQVPPLRVRPSDIAHMAQHYLSTTTRMPKGSSTPVKLVMGPHTIRRMQAVRSMSEGVAAHMHDTDWHGCAPETHPFYHACLS